jgi:hypothetical protein
MQGRQLRQGCSGATSLRTSGNGSPGGVLTFPTNSET